MSAPPRPLEILLVYSQHEPRLRANVRQHLLALERFGVGVRVHYLNAFFGVPRYLAGARFDVVAFHYTFLAWKWNLEEFAWFLRRAGRLRDVEGYKVAFAQDDYANSQAVCAFVREFGIKTLFGLAAQRDRETIYPSSASGLEAYRTIMAGYVDESERPRMESFARPHAEREIDIGYRARRLPYWLGRLAHTKFEIGERVRPRALELGLRVDISSRDQDALLGTDWFRFLGNCRTALGSESGASLHDPTGSIRRCVDELVAREPDVSFEAAEARCFPGLDGNVCMPTVSPRLFECCILKVCQVLIEADYGGILEPERHYIALRADYSNLDAVLARVEDVDACARIAEQAHHHVIDGGAYTYARLSSQCLGEIRGRLGERSAASAPAAGVALRLRARERVAGIALGLVDPYRRSRRALRSAYRAVVGDRR